MSINKLVRRSIKPLTVISGFVTLCIIFYVALLDALHKNSSHPIETSAVRQTLKLSKGESGLQKLFDESVKWAALSKEEKRNSLLDNPVYANFNITKTLKKRKVNVILIVSSGPRRIARRNAIRKTWWKQCHATAGVTCLSISLILFFFLYFILLRVTDDMCMIQ